ncbi:MAG: hypothetical protein DRH90_25555 [Deltaproteobacteria bacterium]|nr:MAG: hypothetical protein DRH90_25555 [Deltaproteobacteria bacterium]
MSEPITPKFLADTVVCQTISIHYNQVWDGAAWVVTPADITVLGVGQLSEGANTVVQADIKLFATTLPAGGQTALQQLLQYIEAELATKYS